jgi:hypothetical protein
MDEEIITEEESKEPEGMNALDTKVGLALRVVRQLKDQIDNLERLLESRAEPADLEFMAKSAPPVDSYESFDSKSIDGVFDGVHMIGEDGRKYLVPPNYASKSKLVEGDLLRLSITDNGRFLFKQKGPIERQRLVGSLVQDELTGDWKAVAGGSGYKLLAAAISFHKGEVGDDIVILVPRAAPSRWAAVENIIKKDGENW